MLNRNDFLTVVAREGLTNPRAQFYGVQLLTPRPVAHPFITPDEVVPVVALQFAVEHLKETSRRRVITLARSSDGYAVWCGDPYTEGRLEDNLTARRIAFDAAEQIPDEVCITAFQEMLSRYGSYPYHAPCHFWTAWHSHQGLCKHVAAALQFVDTQLEGGLESTLNILDEAYARLMQIPVPSITGGADVPTEIDLSVVVQREQERLQMRGAINQLFLEVAAMAGGPTAVQYSRLQQLLTELTSR